MTFRFQRRIKILPGLRLNVSKTGFALAKVLRETVLQRNPM
jgi:hypothetical protein